jgi:hypothetical protein
VDRPVRATSWVLHDMFVVGFGFGRIQLGDLFQWGVCRIYHTVSLVLAWNDVKQAACERQAIATSGARVVGM